MSLDNNSTNIRIRKHDRLQLELKLEYPTSASNSQVQIDFWFQLPKSIGVNSADYTPTDFYGDMRSYTRLTTPQIALSKLNNLEDGSPLGKIWVLSKKSAGSGRSNPIDKKLRQESKLLSCIFRRSLDSCVEKASQQSNETILEEIQLIKGILSQWRSMRINLEQGPLEKKTKDCFRYVDDAMSLHVRRYCTKIMGNAKKLNETVRRMTLELDAAEKSYQESQQSKTIFDPKSDGAQYLIRVGNLKKFVNSILYLEPFPDKSMKWIRHFSLSLAAALAMLWAVLAQVYAIIALGLDPTKATNVSLFISFAVIAVLSYVLKDRIKATTGVWITKKLAKRFSDRKLLHLLPASQVIVVETSDQMRFIHSENMPAALETQLRSLDTSNLSMVVGGESLWYRRGIKLHHSRIHKRFSRYHGITEIIRINVWRWIQTLDDPKQRTVYIDEDSIQTTKLRRVYLVDLIVRITDDNQNEQWVFSRIWLNRRGIVSLSDIEVSEAPLEELEPPL